MAPLHTRGTVLVVDDEPLIRWSLHQRLSKEGYAVLEAADVPEALRAADEHVPDLVLLDYKLPSGDGLMVLERLRVRHPGMLAVMVTAISDPSIVVRAMKLGAIDYLTKPIAMEELSLVVGRAFERIRLNIEVRKLQSDQMQRFGLDSPIAISQTMREVLMTAEKAAGAGSVTVLLRGESGVGKDMIARLIHLQSPRHEGPYVSVNCSAIPDALMESELFGHERGAFTDARTSKEGLFKSADGGTMLLNEIGDMNYGAQSKLLSVLEERQFRPVGSTHDIPVDVRVIAATNVDLEDYMRTKRFREDLFYRLNVLAIDIPPLRTRREDIIPLTKLFLTQFSQKLGRTVRGITPEAEAVLRNHSWPGNVRELRNLIERILVLDAPEFVGVENLHAISNSHDGAWISSQPVPERVSAAHMPAASSSMASASYGGIQDSALPEVEAPMELSVLDEAERSLILDALRRAGNNRSKAARILNITRDTLRYRLKKYGIEVID